jgi:hypothetical protein
MQTIKDIMEIFLSQEELKRYFLLSYMTDFLPFPDALSIMRWITQIPEAIKKDVMNNYQRAFTVIFQKKLNKKK